jgi:hypothetical protein
MNHCLRNAQLGGVALIRSEVGEFGLRSFEVTHQYAALEQAGPHGHGERMHADQQRLYLLGRAERRQRLLEPSLREAQETASMMHH